MDEYKVKINSHAYQDLDSIYRYVSTQLDMPQAAEHIVTDLEQGIKSLARFPERGSIFDAWHSSEQRYHRIIVRDYIIVYTISEKEKEVRVLTVRYARSNLMDV